MNAKNRLIEKLLKVAKKHKILTYPVLALVAVISVFNYFFSWSTGAGKRVVAVVMVLVMLVSQSYFLTSSATALVDTEETVQEQQELQEQKNSDLVDSGDVQEDSSDTEELVESENTTEVASEETQGITESSETSSETSTEAISETTSEDVTEDTTSSSTDTTEILDESTEVDGSVFTEDTTTQNGTTETEPGMITETETPTTDKATEVVKCLFIAPDGGNIGTEFELIVVDGGYQIPSSNYTEANTALAGFTEDNYYSCEGWYTGPGGTGTKIEGDIITGVSPTNNLIKLYPKKTLLKYKVTINPNGGDLTNATVTGEGVTTPTKLDGMMYFDVLVSPDNYGYFTLNDPTRIGYSISGASGDGAGTANGTTLPVKLSGSTHTRIVNLDWKAEKYNIQYVGKDVEGNVVGQFTQENVEFDNPVALFPDANDTIKNARIGYSFVGWTDSDGATATDVYTVGSSIKNNTALQMDLYEQYAGGGIGTLYAAYKYAGIELKETSLSYEYRQVGGEKVIQAAYVGGEESTSFTYSTPKFMVGGSEMSEGDVESTYGLVFDHMEQNGLKVSTAATGPIKTGTIVVSMTVEDTKADANTDGRTQDVTFTITIDPCELELKPESVPSKTYDGTTACTNIAYDKIPTNVPGVYVKLDTSSADYAQYVSADVGNPNVSLKISSTGWLDSSFENDSEDNYSFNTKNATIPGEITQRMVYINTFAKLDGKQYVRAGEPDPIFYAEEVKDANSTNTGLVGTDADMLNSKDFLILTTHEPRNNDQDLYNDSDGQKTYLIKASAGSGGANYKFSTVNQGEFTVVLESPDTRYIMPEKHKGWYGPESVIELKENCGYTLFKMEDGSTSPTLKLTEENTKSGYIKFQLLDASGAFTSFAEIPADVDTTKPVFEGDYEVTVDTSGSGEGLYFPSAGGNLSFGHYYNKTLTFTIKFKDEKSKPDTLYYTLSNTLGGDDSNKVLEKTFGTDNGDGIATAKFEIAAGFVNGELANKIGTIEFRAVDKAGNYSDFYQLEKQNDEWAVEQVGPEVVSWGVKAGESQETSVKNNSDLYYTKCTAYVAVKDTTSGLYGVTWHINDDTYEDRVSVTDSKVDTETFSINVSDVAKNNPSGDGTYTVYPVITDNAGNHVSLKDQAITFKVDDEEPDVKVLDEDKYNSYQQSVTIAFESFDKLSGIQYLKIEDENGELNLSDYTVEAIGKNKDGYDVFKCYMNTPKKGTYYIKAVDNAGNSYSKTIVLDKVSNEVPECPAVTFSPEVNEKGWITSDEAKAIIKNITFTTDNTPVDTKYQLWKDGETSLHITTIESSAETEELPLSDGVYKLKLWSESATGKLCEGAEDDAHIYTIQIDTVAPTIEYQLQKGSDNSLVVNFTVKDDVSGVDGETIKVYNGAYPVSVKVEQAEDGSGYVGSFAITEVGTYTIEAADIAGNAVTAPAFKPMSMKVNAVKNISSTAATVGARVLKGSYDIESATISYRRFSDESYKEVEAVSNKDENGNVAVSAVLANLEKGTNYVYKITAVSAADEVLEYVGYFKTLSDDETGITISGTAKYKDNREGYITVGLFSGNSCIRAVEVDTSVGNTFSFYNVPDGSYDAIATDGVFANNRRVVISNGRIIYPESGSVDLELSGMNTSVVITTDETPDVTADNLSSIFNDETNYTDDDKALVNDGRGTVEFRLYATLMKVSDVSSEEISVMYSTASSKDKIVGAYLDLTLYKIITDENGNVSRKQIHDLGGGAYASVTIPLGDLAGKSGLEVIRIHKNGDHFTGAYLVDQDNNPSTYTVLASQFSTYAVLYDPEKEPATTEEIKDGTLDPSKNGVINNTTEDTSIDQDEKPDDKEDVDDDDKEDKDDSKSKDSSSVGSLTSPGSAKTGDASPLMLMFAMLFASIGGLVVLLKKAKE